MLHYVTILGALVLWSFGVRAATVTTCNSQLKDLATEMDEAFSRVVADVEILVAGRGSTIDIIYGSTSPPVASDPPQVGWGGGWGNLFSSVLHGGCSGGEVLARE